MSMALAELQNSMSMWEDNKKLSEIRKLFAPKLTDIEFEFFCGMGKASNLNPFTREIWAVKYQDSAPAQVFIGRDGYRKAAQRHADYDYHQCDAVYENDSFKISKGEVEHNYTLKERGKLVGAYCIVKRRSAEKPMYVFVELSEYTTGKSLWNQQTGKPATMIKKVAESQCLRACFQDLLGGTYGEEEMARAQAGKVYNISPKEGSQTERLKQILNVDKETGEVIEEEKKVYNSGSDDILISDEQLDELTYVISEVEFSPERLEKALKYYKVASLEQLTDAQARLFLLQLKKL